MASKQSKQIFHKPAVIEVTNLIHVDHPFHISVDPACIGDTVKIAVNDGTSIQYPVSVHITNHGIDGTILVHVRESQIDEPITIDVDHSMI